MSLVFWPRLRKREIPVYFFFHHSIRSDDVLEYAFANMSVHSAQRIVEHEYVGIGVQGSSEADALLLATG